MQYLHSGSDLIFTLILPSDFLFFSYIPAVHLLLYSIVILIYSLLLQFVLMLHMFGFGKHRVNGASLSFVRQAAQNPPVLLW